MRSFTVLCLLAACLLSAHAGDKSEWKKRTIYQIITDRFAKDGDSTEGCGDLHKYCGGTFKGIENHLDYIKGMGFDAIWISPVPKNKGDDYHGYAFLDLYEINEHFGSKDDLKSLISAAHNKGIWIMLDVVANHAAPVDLDFSQVKPFNLPEHYHDKCDIVHWDNQWEVEHCRLANLPDLRQDENQWVADTLTSWVHDIIQEYDIDGIRVDTVPEVSKDFWRKFAEAAGVYQVGEVFNGDIGYVSGYQGSLDAVLNYPMYFTLKDVFQGKQSMYNLRNTLLAEKVFPDRSILGMFIDNHDNSRFLCFHGDKLPSYHAAQAFVLLHDGIPIVYYGAE